MFYRTLLSCLSFFFFTDTATTEIYTLSLHDALPIYPNIKPWAKDVMKKDNDEVLAGKIGYTPGSSCRRSEEHTSELQSLRHLVCRLLLEKKKQKKKRLIDSTKQHCKECRTERQDMED